MEQSIAMNDVGAIGAAGAGAKPKARRFRRLVAVGAAVCVGLLAAHLAWTASGSNAWEIAVDRDGVKVWTMKSPGSPRTRVKAQVRVRSPLAGIVTLLEDLDSCADAWCYDTKVIRRLDMPPGQYGKYVRFKFDVPVAGFLPREYVLFSEHVQDPKTGEIVLNIMAAPDMLPRDACCVRVTHLHNRWQLTPLPNGELNVQFTQDTDLGGLHYLLANLALKEGMSRIFQDLQGLLDKDRYRKARVDYIREPGAN